MSILLILTLAFGLPVPAPQQAQPQAEQLAWTAGEWNASWGYLNGEGGYDTRDARWHTSYRGQGLDALDEINEYRADGSVARTVIYRTYDPADDVWSGIMFETGGGSGGIRFTGRVDEQGVLHAAGESLASPALLRIRLSGGEGTIRYELDVSRDGGETWLENAQVIEGTRS